MRIHLCFSFVAFYHRFFIHTLLHCSYFFFSVHIFLPITASPKPNQMLLLLSGINIINVIIIIEKLLSHVVAPYIFFLNRESEHVK